MLILLFTDWRRKVSGTSRRQQNLFPSSKASAWSHKFAIVYRRQLLDRPVENPPVFIPLGGPRDWPYAMAAHWRSRLRIGHGKGVREQGTEPGTLVTAKHASTKPRPAVSTGNRLRFCFQTFQDDLAALIGRDSPVEVVQFPYSVGGQAHRFDRIIAAAAEDLAFQLNFASVFGEVSG